MTIQSIATSAVVETMDRPNPFVSHPLPQPLTPQPGEPLSRASASFTHAPTTIQARADSTARHVSRTATSYRPARRFDRRPMIALLIAAHNEEMVLTNTVRSAIRAGMPRRDIYVVDDNSSDSTSAIARDLLGAGNVVRVDRSGKGLALSKAAKHFGLTRRYQWIHIADADGGFAPDYFAVFRSHLDIKYAAATGYIKSLPGGAVSKYRVFEYTIGLEIHRRFQALTDTVTVIPGPTSCFRADVFSQVDFANHSLTEDFDVTLQIHRKKLGRIQFITKAVAYTQDPMTVQDFVKQITRWYRGLMQGIRTHRIGWRMQRIDAYLTYQLAQNLLFFASYFLIAPLIAIAKGEPGVLAIVFLYDAVLTAGMTVAVAAYTRRWDILSAFPHIYALRWVSLAVFLRAVVEVSLMGKYRDSGGAWNSVARYQQPTPTA